LKGFENKDDRLEHSPNDMIAAGERNMTNRKAVLRAVVALGSVCLVLTGQPRPRVGVFTAAQAEAGRIAYENTCARCHTYTLLGRTGAEGELPPVSSLSEADQKFIGNPNHVPPLAGEVFLSRWGQKTVAALLSRFEITVRDPNFHFKDVNDDTTVIITAYVLEKNGAKPGPEPLTRATNVVINSIVK
jgi:hypothetical protein